MSRRHIFNLNRPLLAGSIRIVCATAGCALDEIEAYGHHAIGMTHTGASGGKFDHNNWATNAGNLVFASSSAPLAEFQSNNVIDGKYGDDHSWHPASGQQGLAFVGVSFPSAVHVHSIAVGRDNTGSKTDGTIGQYTVQYSTKAASANTPDTEWTTVGASDLLGNLPSPALRHVWTLSKNIKARAIRVIVSNTAMAVDEIEVYPHAAQ